jgi:carbamoyl-phosphate synthase small subunit
MKQFKKAKLVFEDGTTMEGYSFGYEGSVSGEVVFNTAMTGYPESLTDPSYKGQILVLTYPLVGNYGVPATDVEQDNMLTFFESEKIHVSGLVIAQYSLQFNHWNAAKSLGEWLTENKIPGIFGLDTRAITKKIREKGAMLGKIIVDDVDVDLYDPNLDNLVDQVSHKERVVYGNGKYRILLVDCGVKFNIIRYLLKDGDTTVIRVPWDYDFSKEEFDGLFISNGPGDPKKCVSTIENIRRELEGDRPIFGICLGHQLMSLASGADTFKLKFGHRSHNQPVLKCGTKRAYVTSQNHGFAVDNNALTPGWEANFINLNDGTSEGIRHISKPFFSTQFHPEASSGPTDTAFLFDEFLNLVKKWKDK